MDSKIMITKKDDGSVTMIGHGLEINMQGNGIVVVHPANDLSNRSAPIILKANGDSTEVCVGKSSDEGTVQCKLVPIEKTRKPKPRSFMSRLARKQLPFPST